jgi:hypothetical protein
VRTSAENGAIVVERTPAAVFGSRRTNSPESS